MKKTRRDFLKGASAVAGAVLAGCGTSSSLDPIINTSQGGRRPNILLVLVDQMRLPPTGYGDGEGEAKGVKEILGFHKTLSQDNPFAEFFPGLGRLRKNGAVMRRHYIASAACAPSRTTFITGQYPSLHGVTQVDGLFKAADEIKFLDPQGVPTIGDWFQAAGYDPYYFGKWHVSHVEPPYDLTPWGFLGYETSGPEPHGSDPDNLGTFRDPGFAGIVSNFFSNRAKDASKPWFAVASMVNPHDIAAYPYPFYLPGGGGVTGLTAPLELPQSIPAKGTISHPDSSGRTVELNPLGFPQECFDLPPTFGEDLSGKPDCHSEAAWKCQLGLASLFPDLVQNILPYPTQKLGAQQQDWARAYGQFYIYLQHLVDLELKKIFDSFDANGLADNTVVVFTSDHGEYAMAHGQMLQKWYTGYEETVRVPFVVSSPLINPSSDEMLEFHEPTSHVDLAPTLLGLAGVDQAGLAEIKTKLQTTHTQVRDFVGVNLATRLSGGAAPVRPGVLFTTDDDVTNVPLGVATPEKQTQFDRFLTNVDDMIADGAPLVPGPVVQPSAVRMLASTEWKIARYVDYRGINSDQWELYHLVSDPNETNNLLDFRTGALRPGAVVAGVSQEQLGTTVTRLKAELLDQEQKLLLVP